jgi:spore germination protein YaaH
MDGTKYRWIGLIALVAILSPPMTSATAKRTVVTSLLAKRERTLSAWIANWDGGAGYRQVLAHSSRFRFVSPYWYFTTDDPGTIGLNPPATTVRQRATWLSTLHSRGIRVVPTVGSRWSPDKAESVFTDPTLSEAHVNALVALVLESGYDGIDLDYEGFAHPRTASQAVVIRHAYAAFVRRLCGRLHSAGKTCTITLGAETTAGPRIVNDYRAIGRTADLVRLMCYDLHGPWGGPGPVTTTPWTARVLRFATSRIPPSKIELDVPTYGYQWPVPAGGDGSLTWQQTQQLIRRLHLVVHYSTTIGEAYAHWRSGGHLHTAWFETARSLAPKVALANRFHVRSLGFWIVGAEDPGDWTVLRRLHIF